MNKSSPIRILQVIHRMRPGGVQSVVMNHYRNLDRNKIQFDFAVRSQRVDHYDEEIKSLGGRIFHLPWQSANPASFFNYPKALGKVLDEYGPFAGIHSHVNEYSGLVLPIAKRQGIPVRISHSHNSEITGYHQLLLVLWKLIMRQLILGNATDLLACNQLAADFLYGSKVMEDARLKIIHNAIDIAKFHDPMDDRIALRKALGFPLNGLLFGHIGRFDYQKNHQFLVKIFAAYLKKDPWANLLLIGEGDLMPETKSQVKSLGIDDRIHFLGIRKDVPEILKTLDLFLLPSRYEGLPVVLVEAQAAGVPSLVSKSISSEVDLNLGLIHYQYLNSDMERWMEDIAKCLSTPAVPWDQREVALKSEGYDVISAIDELMLLYNAAHEQ